MRALSGLRVVELAGPSGAYCGKLLADQGAAVTIVEPAEGGLLRRIPPFAEDGTSYFHLYYNAGKRSVTLPDDDALRVLLESADVVIAASGPEHVGPDWLAHGIWCSLTPFGLGGPYGDYEATHLTTHASTGLMYDQGPAEGPPVSMPGISVYDEAGIHAAMTVVAALRRRGEVGGQVIDISVQEVISGLVHALQRFALAGVIGKRGAGAIIPPAGTWQCSDGFIELQIWQPAQWDAFVQLLGSPPELADPTWNDRAVRQKVADQIRPVVEAALRKERTHDVWTKAQAARIPSSPVNTLRDFVADEQVKERGFLVDTGDHVTLGRAYRVEGAAPEAPGPVPALGEHNAAVLEELGLAPAAV